MSWLPAGLLVALGVGAVGVVVFQPGLDGGPTEYLTGTATLTDVVEQAAATGSAASTATYGLAFGSQPQKVVAGSTGSAGTTGGTGTTGGSTSGPTSWQVRAVNVEVGQPVKAGDVLATADTADAASHLDAGSASPSDE